MRYLIAGAALGIALVKAQEGGIAYEGQGVDATIGYQPSEGRGTVGVNVGGAEGVGSVGGGAGGELYAQQAPGVGGAQDTFRGSTGVEAGAPKVGVQGTESGDTDPPDPCVTNPYEAECPDPCGIDTTYFFCPDDPCIKDPDGGSCNDKCNSFSDKYPGCPNDECEANPGGKICPDPCAIDPTYMYCPDDPCIKDPGGSCSDPCDTSDTYPGCDNDICISAPYSYACPDPCSLDATYPVCTTTSTSDKDSAFSPVPVAPLLAILPALLIPFLL